MLSRDVNACMHNTSIVGRKVQRVKTLFWAVDLYGGQAAPPFVGHSVPGASLFRVPKAGRRDTCAIYLGQISIESTGIKHFRSADSAGFEFGERLAIKTFTLFNVVTPALREVSGRYLDRRITDDSLRQGLFLYI
jgi:hypothetical protein